MASYVDDMDNGLACLGVTKSQDLTVLLSLLYSTYILSIQRRGGDDSAKMHNVPS